MQPASEVTAACQRCGKPTVHRRDPAGALHCVRCVIEDSIPPGYDEDAPEPAPEPTERLLLRRALGPAELSAAGIAAMAIAVAVYAVLTGHC